MRWILVCTLAVLTPGGVFGADTLDELFAGWAGAQQKTKSLVVEFQYGVKNWGAEKFEKSNGKLRLLRTKKGEVFASYDVDEVLESISDLPIPNLNGAPGESSDYQILRQHRYYSLLSGGTAYFLNHGSKSALRYEIEEGKVMSFLGAWFNPMLALLDRKRAEELLQVEIVKQDEWYTYVRVTPKQDKPDAMAHAWFDVGQIVLMRQDTERVPLGMPRMLMYRDVSGEYQYDIKTWRMNGAEPPTLDEFVKPEDLPGWTVTVPPFYRKK